MKKIVFVIALLMVMILTCLTITAGIEIGKLNKDLEVDAHLLRKNVLYTDKLIAENIEIDQLYWESVDYAETQREMFEARIELLFVELEIRPKTVEVIKEVEKIVYVDRIVEKVIEIYPPDETGYFPWKSLREIKDYVRSTGIPDRDYIKGVYDCENFSLDLVIQANRDNRPIWILGIYKYKADGTIAHHWKCLTIKGLDIYEIEPQTANMWVLQGFDYARPD